MSDETAIYTNFLFYHSENGKTSIQVIADAGAETIWTTQKGMSEIFGVATPAISKHLKNIFESGELQADAVVSKMEITAADGKRYLTNCYNLDAIISVGYRVNSLQATRFRIWATGVLKEFMIKGFALDDERLKQGGTVFGKHYFDELLERIREIRSSERMFYQKLTDIFAQSYDYDKTAQITFDFYSSIQNKLEYAVIGQTAAEIIVSRADCRKEYMGLKTWRDAGKGGKIQLSDTYVAKNYMTHEELSELNQLVNICLDSAELSVKRGRPISMRGWIDQVNSILSMHGYTLLADKGSVSSATAQKHAKTEYEKFRPQQDARYISDFDEIVTKTLKR
ncbi:virulence RhuM family protein [uncultured Alistipes sp.]|uniref:virulence RhuM family protein n=1 Tax=uncultured Alistipes sp. TaxID=538949 RepID=UPI00260B3042|nr:virulence RhuM family protein [uncultured Alistipes sp.]